MSPSDGRRGPWSAYSVDRATRESIDHRGDGHDRAAALIATISP